MASKEFYNKSSKETLSKPSGDDVQIDWPMLSDGGKVLPTEFKEGSWRCPFCSKWTVRIKQHLKTHSKEIQVWEDVEKFCSEVAKTKRQILELKRAQDPKRKQTLMKADEKRAQAPKRKQTLMKADEKRAQNPKRQREDPKRRQTLIESDKKRAQEPKRQSEDPKRRQT